MHDCLRVPEILDQILAIVLQDQPGVKGRNNVISVALSCREFHEIALDVAWKTQSSMVPVIKTLPQRCWKDSTPSTRFNDTMKTFERYFGLLVNRLTVDEEERFIFYAKRIRRLEYLPFAYHAVPTDGCPYDLQIIRTLWATRTDKTQPLFPNLQHLVFAVIDHAAASLDIFLETKQVSLTLYWNSPTNKTSSLFPIIEKHALNMQELDLGDFQDVGRLNTSNDAADPLSGLVCKMPDLRALSCGSRSLNAKAIQHLSSLPHLRKLRVPNNSQEISRGLLAHKQAQAYSQPFPELQDLVIREGELPLFVGLMKELRPVRIQTLLLQLGHVPRTKEIKDGFGALAEQSSSQSNVRSIEFKFVLAPDSRQGWQRPDPFALDKCTTLIDGRTLEPLLSFINLTVLDLDVPCKFDLGDAEIKAMADAWPRLRRLKLGSYLGWHHPSTITYDGLLDLLLKCPHLADLALSFDAASNVPAPSSSAISHAHVNNNITYLYIGDSRIGGNSPDSVGRFLARVMPRCQGISGEWIMQSISSNLSSKSCDEWDRVLEALKRYCQPVPEPEVQEPKGVSDSRKEQNSDAKVGSPPPKKKSFKLFG